MFGGVVASKNVEPRQSHLRLDDGGRAVVRRHRAKLLGRSFCGSAVGSYTEYLPTNT